VGNTAFHVEQRTPQKAAGNDRGNGIRPEWQSSLYVQGTASETAVKRDMRHAVTFIDIPVIRAVSSVGHCEGLTMGVKRYRGNQ